MNENEKKPENPSAFLYVFPADEKKGLVAEAVEGATLRDYFANSAMQGLINSTVINESSFINKLKIFFGFKNYTADFKLSESGISESAYSIADAMLKQREL